MADEEAEHDRCAWSDSRATIVALQERLQELSVALKDSTDSTDQSSSRYCQEFCQTLVEYAGRWRVEEDPFPLVEVYTVALLSYAQASPCLSPQCENVPVVLERLSLSCAELLLSLPEKVPDALWNEFKSSVQISHSQLQENGIPQLSLLSGLAQGSGIWTNSTLHSLFSESPQTDKVHDFLALEGPLLLEMRVKHLIKDNQLEKAVQLAKACAEYPAFEGKGHFKQMHLVCLCAISEQETLMEEISKVDCRDALEMICNLESDGDERGAFSLCSAFLTRQLLQGDSYCAWELTLFWSKLLKRLEESEQIFLDRCRQMSLLSKTVFHILFLIKVIQSEMDNVGLPVCIEMCIRAIKMNSCEGNSKATICKTISCLLPTDLEVKRACQLTEFLLEPTVDSYYAVETLYNEPDQKLEEENLPIPTSLRCELLLVFKTQWPFDPEFWDWKTLKRHCLALMGEEASIVSSIDLLNDSESPEGPEEDDGDAAKGQDQYGDVTDCFVDTTNELKEILDKRQKNREVKKLREKGFISARFRNWQAYMQYCVLCDKEFLGHRIVRHAQTHYKDGVYCCPICTETFNSKDTLVPHVASHVKLSCKERLAAMKTSKKLANPKTAAPVIAALKAKTENQLCTKENGDSQEQNVELPETVQVQVSEFKTEIIAENTCPVGNCRKGFKFLKNLLTHVKAHGHNDEAKRFLEMQSRKVICQYCRRQFVNVTHLNDHLQVHCGIRPYICIQLNCKASFLSNTELLVHRKEHVVFKARCMFPNCGKIFNEAYKLYDHEAQHYNTFTCKFPDCGKVLHSQSQLDSHQEEHTNEEEKHLTEEEEFPPTEVHSLQSPDPLHSLVERMLSDQTPLPQEVCQGNPLTSVHESSLELDSVGMSCSVESMLKSYGPVQSSEREQYVVKSEPLDDIQYLSQQMICSNNSVIRSTMNAQVSDPNQLSHIDISGGPTFNYMRPAPQYPQLPPYQGTSENMQLVLQTNALQSQAPTFSQDGNDCGVSLPAQHQDMSVSKLLAVGPAPQYTQSAMAQILLPAVTPLPPTGNTMKQLPSPSSTTPTTGEKQRHYCSFETCTRNYSSYRSVTKHMKAIHPEFYVQWKLSKRNSKVSKAPSLSMPMVANVAALQNQQVNRVPFPGPQRINVIQSRCHLNMDANSGHPSCSSHSSSIQTHVLSNQMENILDPTVLSQLENTPNQFAPMQPNVGSSPPWHPPPETQNSYPSQGFPSHLQGLDMPQMDAITATVSHGPPSCHIIGSNTRGPAIKPSSVDKGMQPILPIYTGGVKDSSLANQLEGSAPVYTSQTQSKSSSKIIASQRAGEMLNCKKSELALPRKDGVISSGNKADISKRVKRNKRTKWPAIIKDGKYICSRCFREFLSPKSLGGHLSKRSHCKAFDETELTSDLPTSFLDLLNSEQSVNTPQPTPSELYNPSTDYNQDKPSQSVIRNPLDSKCLPNVSYPQADLSAYGIGEHNDEILKHMIDNSNIPDLFDNVAVPQPPFHNSSGPYGGTERTPESSVIQHTGNIKVKSENKYRDHYLQSCDTLFGGSDFSDPLLSQILSEKIPTAQIKEEKRTSDDSNSGGQANIGLLVAMASLAPNIMPTPVIQIMPPDPLCSPTTGIEPAETQRKTIEQDVKKKLREQILAGDFQRRHCSTRSISTETNSSSKNPVSLNPTANIVQHFGAHQSHQSSVKIEATAVGLVHDINTFALAALGQIHESPNSWSFTNFREPSSKPCDTPAPAIIWENYVDLGPYQSSANQHGMMDIQTALEKLDLDREVCDNPQPCLATKPSGNDGPLGNESFLSNLSREKVPPVSDVFVKPFACEQDTCTYRAMTKDAVLKHLTKAHNYTDEMINSLKKNHEKFAPFSCHMCSKTFTRNSNLRAHCQTAHRLSPEEVSKLNPKRNSSGFVNNKDQPSGGAAPAQTAQSVISTNGPHPWTENSILQYSLEDAMKHEHASRPLEHATSAAIPDQRFCDNHLLMVKHGQPVERIVNHNQKLAPVPNISRYEMNPQSSEMTPHPLLISHGTEQCSNVQHLLSNVPTQYLPSQQAGVNLPARNTSKSNTPSNALQTTVSPPLEKLSNKQNMVKPKIEKPKFETPKKMREKKPELNDAFSPYRPYRCVHQGCVAAFTIQHNLILHYRAVHQSTLSTFEVSNENDQNEGQDETIEPESSSPESEVIHVTEFRCQVRDCSRVFQDVPSLLQHYLQLHKFSLDKAGSLMSNINLGKFRCDQHGCAASFTAFWKYIGHVKEEHEKGRVSKVEPVDGMYRCDVDRCDRAYATRSNLLRHTMKKHHDIYKRQLMNQQINEERVKISKSSDGKENIESNKKIAQKCSDKKKLDKSKTNHWTKYGKPSLKTKDEASALCIKKYTLQYPCMIKGCETVMNSERSIMKHYMGHGLSERYLEEQRSHFIFCKKSSRQRYRSVRSDDSKSENSTESEETDTGVEGSEYEYSKPVLRKRVTPLNPELFDSIPSNEDSSEPISDGSVTMKRKRGRPQKLHLDKIVKRKRVSRSTRSDVMYHGNGSDSSSTALTQDDLTNFKPMGFEMSFLKFLEESDKSEHNKIQLRVARVLGKKSKAYLHSKDSCIQFRNPQQLTSLNNVKIIVDGAYSDVADILLKQLQEMRPTVILEQ